MSLLKYVPSISFSHLTSARSLPTLRSPSTRRSSPHPFLGPGLTLVPVASQPSQGSIRRRSRSASSRTVVSPPALHTFSRIPRRIRAQIMNSSVPFPLILPCLCRIIDHLPCFSQINIKNKRLEHVGDQVLGLIVTDLLQSEYPYLRVGPSTVRSCDGALFGASYPYHRRF